jgi:hypothetical protein
MGQIVDVQSGSRDIQSTDALCKEFKFPCISRARGCMGVLPSWRNRRWIWKWHLLISLQPVALNSYELDRFLFVLNTHIPIMTLIIDLKLSL